MKCVILLLFCCCIFSAREVPEPPKPKNGYLLFRENALADNSIPPVSNALELWKNLSVDEKERYIMEGNALKSAHDNWQKIFDDNNDGPLPEDHSLNLNPSDLISAYLDRINSKWKFPNLSYIALRDDPKYKIPGEIPADTLERVANYRYQKTRSCFAQVSLLAYKYVLNEPHMLNFTDAIKKIFKDKESALRGGNTVLFLESLFSKETKLRSVDIANISAELREYGALVISHFRMDITFKDRDIFSHDLYEEKEGWGYHAMLLIGCREDEGKKWFLLQNTWRSKQFVEVSEAYLRASLAQLFKIVSPKPAANLSISANLNNNSEMEFFGDEDFFLEENL